MSRNSRKPAPAERKAYSEQPGDTPKYKIGLPCMVSLTVIQRSDLLYAKHTVGDVAHDRNVTRCDRGHRAQHDQGIAKRLCGDALGTQHARPEIGGSADIYVHVGGLVCATVLAADDLDACNVRWVDTIVQLNVRVIAPAGVRQRVPTTLKIIGFLCTPHVAVVVITVGPHSAGDGFGRHRAVG